MHNITGYGNANKNVVVYDVVGKNILQPTLTNGESLNVSELANGINTIQLDNKVTSKFIKH